MYGGIDAAGAGPEAMDVCLQEEISSAPMGRHPGAVFACPEESGLVAEAVDLLRFRNGSRFLGPSEGEGVEGGESLVCI